MGIVTNPNIEMICIMVNTGDGEERERSLFFNTIPEAEEYWRDHKGTVVDMCWRYTDCEIIDSTPFA